jgi:hypothetical protein
MRKQFRGSQKGGIINDVENCRVVFAYSIIEWQCMLFYFSLAVMPHICSTTARSPHSVKQMKTQSEWSCGLYIGLPRP